MCECVDQLCTAHVGEPCPRGATTTWGVMKDGQRVEKRYCALCVLLTIDKDTGWFTGKGERDADT